MREDEFYAKVRELIIDDYFQIRNNKFNCSNTKSCPDCVLYKE